MIDVMHAIVEQAREIFEVMFGDDYTDPNFTFKMRDAEGDRSGEQYALIAGMIDVMRSAHEEGIDVIEVAESSDDIDHIHFRISPKFLELLKGGNRSLCL